MQKEHSITPAQTAGQARRIILIDGYGFVFRAYHSMPSFSGPAGVPVGAVYGFTAMLMRLLLDWRPDHMAVILDSGQPTFRHELFPAYKANRPPVPEDLRPQFALVRHAVSALQLPMVEVPGYEADDIIATYARIAKEQNEQVIIVSSDKDLMQLVGEGVSMWDPVKNKAIATQEVIEKFGVGPEHVLEVLSLIGDSSDNVPGVPGIGPKTAMELVLQFGGLEAVLAGATTLKASKRRDMLIAHAEEARLSRKLIELCDTVPVPYSLDDLGLKVPSFAPLMEFLELHGFKSLLARGRQLCQDSTSPVAMLDAPVASKATPACYLTDPEKIAAWIKEAAKGEMLGVIPVSLHPKNTAISTMILWSSKENSILVPLLTKESSQSSLLEEATQGISLTQFASLLQPAFATRSLLKIVHDAKQLMVKGGITPITPVDDLMLMSYVLGAGKMAHEYLTIVKHYLEKEPATLTADMTQDALCAAAAEMVEEYATLHTRLKAALIKERLTSVYESIERPLITVLAEMERVGIYIDREQLRAFSLLLAENIQRLEREIYVLAGESFNIGSPKQLGEVLFEKLGIAVGGKTAKTKAYSTGAEVLEEISAAGHVIADKVLEWRQYSKLKSTYADALVACIDEKDQRVHTCFMMAVTSTGRLSSANPNLQNIPIRTEMGQKIRRAFIAGPDYMLLSADYSQIELRLLAHMANIESLQRAFHEGKDIHALTASQVMGVPLAEITPLLRRKAKAINFGIIYGISAHGLARQLGIDRPEAAQYIDAYFRQYPGIQQYMETTKQFARTHHYVETLFGRRCYIPDIAEKNQIRRSLAERAAINAPIQGTAADIIKKAMIEIERSLKEAGFKSRMVLQVHDELLFEIKEQEKARVVPLIKKAMEQVIPLSVPLSVEIGIGDNWQAIH